MITHVRDTEKDQVKKLAATYLDTIDEFKNLASLYKYVEFSKVTDDGLSKLIRKGRLNMTEGKVLFKALYKDVNSHLTITVTVARNTEGELKIHTNITSDFKGIGADEINVYDSLEIASVQAIVIRTLYKISETTLRSTLAYEKNDEFLNQALQMKEQLKWQEENTEEEVADYLENLVNLLDLCAISGKKLKDVNSPMYVSDISFDTSILLKFSQYRSKKDILRMTSFYKGHELVDTLTIEKDERTNKFMYVLRATKVEDYKGILDIAVVEERLEVTKAHYNGLFSDMLDAIKFLAMERSLLTEDDVAEAEKANELN